MKKTNAVAPASITATSKFIPTVILPRYFSPKSLASL